MFSLRCHQLIRSFYSIHTNWTLKEVSPNPSGPCNQRAISTSPTLLVDYYEALGIPAKSTQNEIKAAYYKLSMIYHPDKNQGSDSAAKKFREITQAYEVLSNYRLRRLYDKGIIHTAGSQYAQADNIRQEEEVKEDDPQTKFYKSRFTKSKVANPQGNNPIYDFDEWARAHYGKSLNRKKAAQQKYERKEAARKEENIGFQNEIVIYGVVVGVILFFIVGNMEASYDKPRRNKKDD
ncbi:dnaJ homolog subfamily C member 30, mitochondrial-like [Eupeodes corollae]|uniref:dnaJ homolog subfamily C member 30, mitochondrial-like n=1 Tax=Eupeodes corollae TaxID=290404 RepID=UPI002493A821|nr:dnaJ homolog subfamily C member 30, mitochondrial-like [Eupeodes corollae]